MVIIGIIIKQRVQLDRRSMFSWLIWGKKDMLLMAFAFQDHSEQLISNDIECVFPVINGSSAKQTLLRCFTIAINGKQLSVHINANGVPVRTYVYWFSSCYWRTRKLRIQAGIKRWDSQRQWDVPWVINASEWLKQTSAILFFIVASFGDFTTKSQQRTVRREYHFTDCVFW